MDVPFISPHAGACSAPKAPAAAKVAKRVRPGGRGLLSGEDGLVPGALDARRPPPPDYDRRPGDGFADGPKVGGAAPFAWGGNVGSGGGSGDDDDDGAGFNDWGSTRTSIGGGSRDPPGAAGGGVRPRRSLLQKHSAKPENFKLEAGARAQIAKANALDVRLYALCRRRLHAAAEAHAPADFARFSKGKR